MNNTSQMARVATATRKGANRALEGAAATSRSWSDELSFPVVRASSQNVCAVANGPAKPVANDIHGEAVSMMAHLYCCGGRTLRLEEGFPG